MANVSFVNQNCESCKDGNGTCDSIKYEEFLDQINEYCFPNKDSALNAEIIYVIPSTVQTSLHFFSLFCKVQFHLMPTPCDGPTQGSTGSAFASLRLHVQYMLLRYAACANGTPLQCHT